MILREFFNRKQLNEGGNLEIDGAQAQQIDLKVHNRAYIVPILSQLLASINAGFKSSQGNDLWNPKVLKSRKYLSGSSLHFFDTDIPDQDFERVKPKVGDIDTQINKDAEPHLSQWLNSVKGRVVGNAKFLGYSRGNEQYSSLWELTDPPIKVQIDFEFVDYSEKDEPTDWAGFSHSSSWEDLNQGIKGVFHKYLIGAFTRLTKQDFLLRKLVGRGKARAEQDVPTTDNMLSFAVSSKEGGGLRAKYEPVTDEKGRPLVIDGLSVMRALPAAGYEKDLSTIFQSIFGKRVNRASLQKLLPKTWSFTGLLEVMNLVLTPDEKEQVLDALVDKLFAPGAQGLYKGDAQRDMTEKNAALNYAIKVLKITGPKNLEQMRQDYVNNYKVATEGPVGLDQPIVEAEPEVKSQLRKGMPHLRDLKPADFLDLVDELRAEGGRFKLQNIPLNVKIDGFGGRFGKNAEGKPFMGTSRTEPRYSAGFVDYHKQKGTTDPEILGRAVNFDKLFNEMMDAIKVVDSKLGPDFLVDKQVTCEVLFLPFATQTEEGKLKFVGIEYEQLPQGVNLVLVPYRIVEASTGDELPDEAAQQLANLGQHGSVMFMSNRLAQQEGLDVTEIINPLENLEELKRIVSDTAGKRDRASLELRREVEAKLKPVQIALEKAIDEDPNIIGKQNLGQDYEGIVINTRLGPVKVTSQKQKDIITQKNAAKAAARADQGRENQNKTAVVAIGSFVGHVGHEQLWDYTVKKAAEVGGDPYLFIGNAEGKDDPIPPAVKVQTWHKMYPNYAKNISTVQAGGSLMQKIKHELINPLPGKPPRYDNVIIMVGEDQSKMPIAGALMKAVNKFQGYEHVKVSLEPTPRGTGMSFTKLRNILKDPNATPEQQYAVWAQGFDEKKLGKQWILHLMDITRKGMGITQQPKQQPVAEMRLFNSLVRGYRDMCNVCGQTPCNCTHVNETDEKHYSGWEEYDEDKSAQVAEFMHEMNPGLFSRYGDEFLMNLIQKVCRTNPQASVTQSAGDVIRHLKSSVDEARMSAAVKLQRAFDRERAKSDASRRRGEEVMAQAKKDAEKKSKEQGVAEESDRQFAQRMKKQAEQPPTKGMSQKDKVEKGWAHPDTLKKKDVAEGLPQTLRKVVPGYAKREIDRKMDAGKFGKTDADKDANFQRYKKIQDKLKEDEQVYKVIALTKSNALAKPTKMKVKADSIEDLFGRLAANDWYPLEINGVEVIAGKRLKQGVAEGEKHECPQCDGSGYVQWHGSDTECPKCDGTGYTEQGVAEDTIRPNLAAALTQLGFKGPFKLGQLPAWKAELEGGHFDDDTQIMIKGNDPEFDEWVAKGYGYGYAHGAEVGYQNGLSAKEVINAVKGITEKMLPKSAFAGSDKNKLGSAGQWKNTGPSKNRPAKAGDLVGGAAESVNEDIDRIFATLIDKIIVNEAIQNNQRRS